MTHFIRAPKASANKHDVLINIDLITRIEPTTAGANIYFGADLISVSEPYDSLISRILNKQEAGLDGSK